MTFYGSSSSDLRGLLAMLDGLIEVYWPAIFDDFGSRVRRQYWRGEDAEQRFEMAGELDEVFQALIYVVADLRHLVFVAKAAQATASAAPGGWPTGPGTQFA